MTSTLQRLHHLPKTSLSPAPEPVPKEERRLMQAHWPVMTIFMLLSICIYDVRSSQIIIKIDLILTALESC